MGGVCGHQNHMHLAKSPGPKIGFSYISLDPMKFNIIFENLKLQYPTKSCHFVLTLAGDKLWETPNHIDLDGKHCVTKRDNSSGRRKLKRKFKLQSWNYMKKNSSFISSKTKLNLLHWLCLAMI